MADLQETSQPPEWLIKLEMKPKRHHQLAHEIDAGCACLNCGDKCPGLDLHFWRKMCRNCKCKKESHDIKDDTDYHFDLLLGPSKTRTNERSKKIVLELHLKNGKTACNKPTSVPLDWVPPNVSDELAGEYMGKLPSEKIPITSSNGAIYRRQQIEKQIPLHDLDPNLCHQLTPLEIKDLEDYIANLRKNAVGQGQVVRTPVKKEVASSTVIRSKPLTSFTMRQGSQNTVGREMDSSVDNFTSSYPHLNNPASLSHAQNLYGTFYVKDHLNLSNAVHATDVPKGVYLPNGNKKDEKFNSKAGSLDYSNDLSSSPFQDKFQNKALVGENQNPNLYSKNPEAVAYHPYTSVNFNNQNFLRNPDLYKTDNEGILKNKGVNLEHLISNESKLNHPQCQDGKLSVSMMEHYQPHSVHLGNLNPNYSEDLKVGNKSNFSSALLQDGTHSVLKNPPAYLGHSYEISNQNLCVSGSLNTHNKNLPLEYASTNADKTVHPYLPNQQMQNYIFENNGDGKFLVMPNELSSLKSLPYNSEDNLEGMQNLSICDETIKCVQCSTFIEGGSVAIRVEHGQKTMYWHPTCFVCSLCEELLVDLLYFHYKSKVYCCRDYAQVCNIPRCYACDELIFNKNYTCAEGQTFHERHFCCLECDIPLADKHYVPRNDHPVCLDCFHKKYAKICLNCNEVILASDKRICLNELSWHADEKCFACYQCGQSLLNSKFITKNDKPFCNNTCVLACKTI